MKCSVIIVKFNIPETEKNCIKSVLDNTAFPYDLFVYDNWHRKENLGKLWNELIHSVNTQYICLLNSDCEVEPEWLTRLVEIIETKKKVGAVGPTTNNCRGPQMWDKEKEPKIKDFGEYGNKWQLSGFCFVFPRNIWVEIGGFSDTFGFYGQEAEFMYRVQKAGYKTLWRKDVMIKHLGGASVKKAEEYGIINEVQERIAGNQNYKRLIGENTNS